MMRTSTGVDMWEQSKRIVSIVTSHSQLVHLASVVIFWYYSKLISVVRLLAWDRIKRFLVGSSSLQVLLRSMFIQQWTNIRFQIKGSLMTRVSNQWVPGSSRVIKFDTPPAFHLSELSRCHESASAHSGLLGVALHMGSPAGPQLGAEFQTSRCLAALPPCGSRTDELRRWSQTAKVCSSHIRSHLSNGRCRGKSHHPDLPVLHVAPGPGLTFSYIDILTPQVFYPSFLHPPRAPPCWLLPPNQ